MLKSGNTDWSFSITDIHYQTYAFSFYVNFLQKASSLEEKAHHFTYLKTLLFWNETEHERVLNG